MPAEKPKRDRSKENEAKRRKRAAASVEVDEVANARIARMEHEFQLSQLEENTRGNPTDADGDIDFAYRKMALPNVSPLDAPSPSAWSWYVFARNDADEFLKICAKREDAKAKMAGTITNQRMEDDRRNQFAVLERIGASLMKNVTAIVDELADRFPDDVVEVLTKRGWKVETGSKDNA